MMKVTEVLTWFNVDRLILDAIGNKGVIVPIRPFAIHQNTVRHPEFLPTIKYLSQVLHKTRQTQPTPVNLYPSTSQN
jgi:hypothetical protein